MSRPKLVVTRRQLAATALSAAAAASAAQAPPPSANPDAPADLLAQARQNVVRAREALSQFKIDRAVEPATRFEA